MLTYTFVGISLYIFSFCFLFLLLFFLAEKQWDHLYSTVFIYGEKKKHKTDLLIFTELLVTPAIGVILKVIALQNTFLRRTQHHNVLFPQVGVEFP